jgi:hypothetical protein
LLCQAVGDACQDEKDPTCQAVVRALVESQEASAVQALLELKSPPPAQTLLEIDPELRIRSMEVLCDQVPPASGCEQLVQLLAEAGVEAASARQRLSKLRTLVVAAGSEPESSRLRALQSSLPQGPAAIPDLLELIESGSLKNHELQLVDQAIAAYGDAARPYLVAAVKSHRMPVSLRAARAGWDPAADELEDRSRLEGPKRTVQVTDAAEYIGKQLRIYHKDGTMREGVLTRINDDILYVETRIGGGVITTRIERANVDRIQF